MSKSFRSDAVDLEAYRKRVGYEGPLCVSADGLQNLHRAHATHIPFENLDILLGREIRLDLASLQAKLLAAGRGGYCFEQNLLFSHVLCALGFPVIQLAARVRLRATRAPPRTHMALLVNTGAEDWLADVGFGGGGLLAPLPLCSGVPSFQAGTWFRLLGPADHEWTLQAWREQRWRSLYSFTLEPHYQPDYEMASYYTSTHPDSRFVKTLTAQRLTHAARFTLVDAEFTEDNGQERISRTLADHQALLGVLAAVFGLRFSEQTVFKPDLFA